ncbi:hypothetical protein STEG23_018230, partial [Scotinomys teguina]
MNTCDLQNKLRISADSLSTGKSMIAEFRNTVIHMMSSSLKEKIMGSITFKLNHEKQWDYYNVYGLPSIKFLVNQAVSVEGHLDCFEDLVIMNNGAINIVDTMNFALSTAFMLS